MKAASITATAKPENPGNEINKYRRPHTTAIANKNNTPCIGESILNAVTKTKIRRAKARIFKNICKDEFFNVKLMLTKLNFEAFPIKKAPIIAYRGLQH